MQTENITLPLRHDFSDEELKEMSDNLADLVGEQTTVELEKKEVNKDFKERLDTIKARQKTLAQCIRDGHTEHDIACTIRYNHPSRDVKTIVRQDTGHSWTEEMTEADWNLFTQHSNEEE